jgi:hypothetical protein
MITFSFPQWGELRSISLKRGHPTFTVVYTRWSTVSSTSVPSSQRTRCAVIIMAVYSVLTHSSLTHHFYLYRNKDNPRLTSLLSLYTGWEPVTHSGVKKLPPSIYVFTFSLIRDLQTPHAFLTHDMVFVFWRCCLWNNCLTECDDFSEGAVVW